MKTNPESGAPEGRGDEPIRIEGDVMFVRICGALGIREMQAILTSGDAITASYGYMLVLADAALTTSIEADARKLQSERLKRVIHPSYTAIYGASTATRLMNDLLQRGVELVTGKRYPISFHASEADARAMIDRKREELQRSSARSSRVPAPR